MGPSARFEAGSPDHRFQNSAATFWQVYFQYHPETATRLGVPGHNHRLNPFSDDVEEAKRLLAEHSLDELATIPGQDLQPDNRLDWRILQAQLQLALDAQARWDWRLRDPAAFLPIEAVYQLTVRPVPDFGFALHSRLAAFPRHLQEAGAHLSRDPDQIPAVWLESACQEARGAIDFLQQLPRHPKVLDAGVELSELLPAAQRACAGFADLLEKRLAPRARGDFAVGQERYDLLLALRHALPVRHGVLKSLGERLFRETLAALKAVTRELRGDEDIPALSAALRQNHPDADQLLAAYRDGMQAVRRFVQDRELLTLPVAERLDVVETPVFLRHRIPFAAYMDPAPNDPEQHGYYYVTPVRDAAQLAEHDWAGLLHTCAHEAYPGHHVQFVLANAGPGSNSTVRLLNASATLYEGWALYCEQLMLEQGFLQRPENRFILLKDRLWRALRILIDVGIQCEGMSFRQAVELLVTHLGFPEAQARGELTWYCQAPGVPMGYATGWALINALRDEQMPERSPLLLKNFHDRLLSVGSVGLPWVIERAFGETAVVGALRKTFGNELHAPVTYQ